MNGKHLDWFIKVLESLDKRTRIYAIRTCQIMLCNLKQAYPMDVVPSNKNQQLAGNRLHQPLQGVPTIDALKSSIERVLNCGVSEAFIITGLYYGVTAHFECLANPDYYKGGEDLWEQYSEVIAQMPNSIINQVKERHDYALNHLASVDDLLAERKEILSAWLEATVDRNNQPRIYGAWLDMF